MIFIIFFKGRVSTCNFTQFTKCFFFNVIKMYIKFINIIGYIKFIAKCPTSNETSQISIH